MPLTEHDIWLLGQEDEDLGSEQLHRKRELEKSMGMPSSAKEVFEDEEDKGEKPPAK